METDNGSKNHFLNWSQLGFLGVCTISFAVALVFSLEIPLKLALIYGLCPIGAIILIVVLLSWQFKLNPKIWRDQFRRVAEHENYTEAIKSILFPVLLVILYFHIKGEAGQNFLFTISPIKCDMIIHPCGSSYLYQTTEVWDAADLISQPSYDEVFIITNTVVGKEQTRGICPQTGAYCSSTNLNPGRSSIKWLQNTTWTFFHSFSRVAIWNPVTCQRPEMCDSGVLYDNGIQTGSCDSELLCNIVGWCPPIKIDDFSTKPKFQTENFTIFLDLKPKFPEFHGSSWTNGGDAGYVANYDKIYAKHYRYDRSVASCIYHPASDPYCPRFRLEDIVILAEKEDDEIVDFAEIAAYGGQYKIEADWSCRFDWGNDIFDCLPKFTFFNQGTSNGKPKMFPKIISQNLNNRTVTYNLGISVSISHVGNGRQIQLFNVLMYVEFIYVSFVMIKGPFLWVSRCLITTFFLVRCSQPIKSIR